MRAFLFSVNAAINRRDPIAKESEAHLPPDERRQCVDLGQLALSGTVSHTETEPHLRYFLRWLCVGLVLGAVIVGAILFH